jgi:hypothetical protein
MPYWRVGEPLMRLGSLNDSGPETFGRVTGITVRRDGIIVVADDQRLQLKAFDRSASLQWESPGNGDGPGEFRGLLHALALAGDSVLGADYFGRRIHVFGPEGNVARTFSLNDTFLDAENSSPEIVGVLDNGVIVATHLPGPAPDAPLGTRFRPSPSLVLFGRDGEALSELGRYPSTEIVITEMPAGLLPAGVSFVGPNIRRQPVTMGPKTVFAVSGDRIAVGRQDRFSIALYDGSGNHEVIIRVNAAAVRPNRTRFLEAGGATGDILPEILPAFGRLRLSSQGDLWVEEFVPSYENRAPQWWIFGSDGSLLAYTILPGDFTPFEIESDHVVGRWLDELDVPYVEVRPIAVSG